MEQGTACLRLESLTDLLAIADVYPKKSREAVSEFLCLYSVSLCPTTASDGFICYNVSVLFIAGARRRCLSEDISHGTAISGSRLP